MSVITDNVNILTTQASFKTRHHLLTIPDMKKLQRAIYEEFREKDYGVCIIAIQ